MTETESEMSVEIAILSTADSTLAAVNGRLESMQGEFAVLTVPGSGSGRLVRWGSRLRFWTTVAGQALEATGAVVSTAGGTDGREDRQVVVRLWECVPRRQKRSSQRQPLKTPLRMRLVHPDHANSILEESWIDGWGVDISAGGARVRVPDSVQWSGVVELEIPAGEPAEPEILRGRVLRVRTPRANMEYVEVAVKFECLSVESGLRLAIGAG